MSLEGSRSFGVPADPFCLVLSVFCICTVQISLAGYPDWAIFVHYRLGGCFPPPPPIILPLELGKNDTCPSPTFQGLLIKKIRPLTLRGSLKNSTMMKKCSKIVIFSFNKY